MNATIGHVQIENLPSGRTYGVIIQLVLFCMVNLRTVARRTSSAPTVC